MKLEDLKVYQLAMEIGEIIWNCVKRWDYFEKRTVGKQLVDATDSVAANISEGYGRYFYRDSKVFYYYARGSAQESLTWIRKAGNRKLISDEEFCVLEKKMNLLIAMLNNYIKSIGPS